MTRIVVDTNVLVSFLTDRNIDQQRLAAELFELASAGTVALRIHQSVLTELVYVLGNVYEVEPASQAAVLSDLLSMPGIETFDEVSWRQILEVWPNQVSDFTDAILASASGSQPIATFDRRFVRQLRKRGQESYWPE